jgi:hypothetical protein
MMMMMMMMMTMIFVGIGNLPQINSKNATTTTTPK